MDKNKEKAQCMCMTMHTPSGLHVRETEGAEGQSRTITGYAILFGTPSEPLWSDEESEAREVIAPGAVTRGLLDGSDIKMTMFHDRQLILARSNKGEGTLSYSVDEKGVSFEFDAPRTADGDKALELVRRGDIAGCSFAFSTYYWDAGFVAREVEVRDGRSFITYRVDHITGIYDFTLAADPAYPATSVETRQLREGWREEQAAPAEEEKRREQVRRQIGEMRRAAAQVIS